MTTLLPHTCSSGLDPGLEQYVRDMLGRVQPSLDVLERQTVLDRKTRQAVDTANRKLGLRLPHPVVLTSLRGTRAGLASGRHGVVNYNLDLALANWDPFLQTIVPHEVAHLFAFHIDPSDRPHGPVWSSIMTGTFGLPADRCHHFSVDGLQTRTVRRWTYACGCSSGCTLGSAQHRRLQSGIYDYTCRTCGHRLTSIQAGPA